MPANCTKTPENHGGEVFQLEHSFSDLWMILKAAKSHSSGHVGIICQRGLGWANALVLWRPGLRLLLSQRQKAVCILGHQVIQAKTDGRLFPGLIQSSRFKRQWGLQAARMGKVPVARGACLYDLPSPSGATVHRAWIVPLELNWSAFPTRLRAAPSQHWRWQCSGGQEAQRGHLVTEYAHLPGRGTSPVP